MLEAELQELGRTTNEMDMVEYTAATNAISKALMMNSELLKKC